jgi:hypothetical protein
VADRHKSAPRRRGNAMPATEPPSIDPVLAQLLLCLGNRSVFLQGIYRFCWKANRAELEELRKAIRRREAKLRPKSGKKRGRPRAGTDPAWMSGAHTVRFGMTVLGWTWARAAVESGLKPTKANIRTVQRRQKQLADLGFPLPIESKL